jgi:hypothetical protein
MTSVETDKRIIATEAGVTLYAYPSKSGECFGVQVGNYPADTFIRQSEAADHFAKLIRTRQLRQSQQTQKPEITEAELFPGEPIPRGGKRR